MTSVPKYEVVEVCSFRMVLMVLDGYSCLDIWIGMVSSQDSFERYLRLSKHLIGTCLPSL